MNQRTIKIIAVYLIAFPLLHLTADEAPPSWPKPELPPSASDGTAPLARFMELVTNSTSEKRATVRVLFYGQSITRQWSQSLEETLRKTYPFVNFVFAHKAIGGFTADRLIQTTPTDVNSFYPDLMVFHVYTNKPEPYEEIIRQTLANTTTEILLVNNHIVEDSELQEVVDPEKVPKKTYTPWHNNVFMPELSRRYGVDLVDVRSAWKDYMRANNLSAQDLLSDSVHLNKQGIFLITELIASHLRNEPTGKTGDDRVKDYFIEREVAWKDNQLELEFEGNRVDLIAAEGDSPETTCEIFVDGKRPSELPGTTVFTRTSGYPDTWWPSLLKVSSKQPLVEEDWTARIFDATDDLSSFKFEVTGSVTGKDGVGISTERFESKSGRVIIMPEDWHVAFARSFTKQPMPEGFTVKWTAEPLSKDEYQAPPVPSSAIETATTVVQGIPNGRHRLTLACRPGTTPPPLKSIRVYRPRLASDSLGSKQ